MKKPKTDVDVRNEALNAIIRTVQTKYYKNEFDEIQKTGKISNGSNLLQLYPFVDENKILRVGGRITAADCLSENTKFPAILPKADYLSYLIVTSAHSELLHSGVNATIAHTRQNFWIIGVKQLAKQIVSQCVKCFRYNSRKTTQLMGDLPSERVNPSPPFTFTGIDLAGPLLYKEQKLALKCYVIVFTCFSTKAVHLDLVKSLNAQDCMKALRRFISRRGCPQKIFSDNGTNFIGTMGDLVKFKKLVCEKFGAQTLPKLTLELGLNWYTIPARAPNFGGLWEAAVKSMKLLLKKTIGRCASLQYDELYTIICQIEGILNSRPLTSISDDSKDTSPITPSMLLNGFNSIQLPLVAERVPKLITDDEKCPVKRLRYMNRLITEFWKKWSSEYITGLQTRKKNCTEKENLKKGDLVYLAEDNIPALQWPLGLIIDVFTGNDNLVRVAKVKASAEKTIIRPVTKLRKLPLA